MKKIIFPFLIICLLLLNTGNLGAQVTIVGDPYGGNPYSTIQAAIDACSGGETINVSAGTYNEDLIINVPNLELSPNTGDAVTIKGVDTEPVANWPLANPNIEILANGIKIHGFTIESPSYVSGFYSSGMVIGAANVEIYSNAFKVWAGNDAGVGDEISQAIQTYSSSAMPGVDISGLNIHDNTFTNLNSGTVWGYEGIYVNLDEGTGTITIADNAFSGEFVRAVTIERSEANITGNTIITDLPPLTSSGALEGISIRNLSLVAQSNIDISGNEVNGSGAGIGFLRGIRLGISGQTLTGITVTGNDVAGNTTGVLVRSSANGVLINNNDIFGNTTGMTNEDAANTLNAENNWWGDASGPSGFGPGTGDAVSDFIDFDPFKPFSFINTPATAYDIFLASNSTSTASDIVYPNDSWETTAYSNDWNFTAPIDLYIVPEVGSIFGACDIVIQWDNSLFSFVGVDETGGIYDGVSFNFQSNQFGNTDQVTINASRLDITNFTTVSGDYIAKLQLNLLKPGFGPINFISMDIRAFDGGSGQEGVYVVGNSAAVKSYLGDVAAPGDESTGDGLINIEDLTVWTGSYWSGVPGFAGGLTNYKVKYDVGPTADNTVYSLPVPDNMIQFEDMVIFAISYGLSGNNVYPKTAPAPETPVELNLGEPMFVGNETLIPLYLKGTVVDVRALELAFSGTFGKLLSVEKGTLLQNLDAPIVMMNSSSANSANVDVAVFGVDAEGVNAEGELLTLRFEGMADVQLSSANVRNSGNNSMKIEITNSNMNVIPTSFALDQNYPNPFNPSTIISYQLPEQQFVNVVIFNMLGEEVSTLVNEVKDAGYYKIEWNGSNLTSGVYFYRIKTMEFVSVKKMMLMK